ncbi:transposase family protein [Endozoicomonas acroporae]|uniref:transposase family protein n=1 Tax=Endozoicomonas acroporae TaxID=1701104 RepID=UPI0013CFCE9F|nr:transposase family protein [Endozoicomonas acroporae]
MSSYTPMVVRIKSLTEPRSEDHVTYPLPEVIFIVYVSILSGYTTWQGMERFAKYNHRWFRMFFPYQFAFPSHYTIATVCKLLDPEAFTQLFVDWVSDTLSVINARKIGPHPEKNDNVLDVLFLEGALITSDAMGCQKNICKKIIEKKADYLGQATHFE